MVLHPTEADTGYRFLVSKRGRIIAEIPADVRYVKNLTLCTVLGDEYVDAALKSTDDFNRPLQDMLNEYCWGALWGREGLPRKTRSMLNLAMTSVLNPLVFFLIFQRYFLEGFAGKTPHPPSRTRIAWRTPPPYADGSAIWILPGRRFLLCAGRCWP